MWLYVEMHRGDLEGIFFFHVSIFFTSRYLKKQRFLAASDISLHLMQQYFFFLSDYIEALNLHTIKMLKELA